MIKKNYFKSLLLIVVVGLFLVEGLLANNEKLAYEKVNLLRKIEDIKSRRKQDKEDYQRFIKQKKKFIQQKQKEYSRLTKENNEYYQELKKLKRKYSRLEYTKNFLKTKNQSINLYLINLIEEIKRNNKKSDFFFEIDKRNANLSAIAIDIKAGKGEIIENYNRILSFLNNEEEMAYNSETLNAIVPFGTFDNTQNIQQKNAVLLRVGRIVVVAKVQDEFYLPERLENEILFSSKKKLSLSDKRKMETAINILQGKKTPAFIDIPIEITKIKQR